MEALSPQPALIPLNPAAGLGLEFPLPLESQPQGLDQLIVDLELRVPGMKAHLRRVSRYAAGTAKQLGLPREEVERVRRAAAVHDVGKLEVPAAIINERGPLSGEQFALVKRHAAAGERIVAGLGDPELAAIVRHHHERVDGGGYPDGLAGEAIPLGARVIAVADTFDAVTSARPYRPARTHGEALELIGAEAGSQLDPEVVAAFRCYYSSPRAVLLRALAE